MPASTAAAKPVPRASAARRLGGRGFGACDHDEEAGLFGPVRKREHREFESHRSAIESGDVDPGAREAAAFAQLRAQCGGLLGGRHHRIEAVNVESDVGSGAATQIAELVAHRADAAGRIGDEHVAVESVEGVAEADGGDVVESFAARVHVGQKLGRHATCHIVKESPKHPYAFSDSPAQVEFETAVDRLG